MGKIYETDSQGVSHLIVDDTDKVKISQFEISNGVSDNYLSTSESAISNLMIYGRSYKSKNLLNPTLTEEITINGVTCTPNGDGTFTLNGTATGYTAFQLKYYDTNDYVGMKFVGTPSQSQSFYVTSVYTDSSGSYAGADNDYGNGHIISNLPKVGFFIVVRSGTVCNNLIFKPMICEDTSATYNDYERYGLHTVKNLDVEVGGKNLFDGLIEQGDSASSTTANRLRTVNHFFVRKGEKYTISIDSTSFNFCAFLGNSTYPYTNLIFNSGWVTNPAYALEVTQDCYLWIVFRRANDTNLTPSDMADVNIQIEEGTQATDYEPYHSDKIQTTLQLNAIPVSSGGNITIDGQMYLSDVIDVEKGEITRYVDYDADEETITIKDTPIIETLSYQKELKLLNTFDGTTILSIKSDDLSSKATFNYCNSDSLITDVEELKRDMPRELDEMRITSDDEYGYNVSITRKTVGKFNAFVLGARVKSNSGVFRVNHFNVDSADRDGNGNVISTTYAKARDLADLIQTLKDKGVID